MLNKCTFIGNLGSDPEVRYMPNGGQVTNISIATTRRWKDQNSGEKREETEWIRCVAFGRLAEIMSEYIKKGSKVYVEGRMKTNKYQAQDGTDRYSTDIIVSEMVMLDSREQGQGQAGNNQGNNGGRQNQQRNSNQGQNQQGNRNQGNQGQNNQGGYNNGRQGGNQGGNQGQNQGGQNYQNQDSNQSANNNGGNGGNDEYDDDIPF